MNLNKIAYHGLRFYWKTHLAAGLAILVASAVLIGALSAGDSITASLVRQTQLRLGKTRIAVFSSNLFRADLAARLSEKNKMEIAPVLTSRGFAENADGSIRVGGLDVLGVDDRFWKAGPQDNKDTFPGFKSGAAVSRTLAMRLKIKVGQEIVVRTAAVGGMAIEAALTPEEQNLAAFRWTVESIVPDRQFGGFDLYARPDSGLNVFVPLDKLNRLLGHKEGDICANLLLIPAQMRISEALRMIQENWQLQDAGLQLREPNGSDFLELRSDNVFFSDTAADSITKNIPGNLNILTYFVNELRSGQMSTPYSFVCAVDGPVNSGFFGSLGPDEMIINEWLADDLKAAEGDKIEIRYFAPSQGKSLTEQTATFTVRAVIPMMGTGADSSLMPAFEALADADNCRDWKPGIPIDLSKIGPEDEHYWQKYKGSPKAFISMKTAKLLWSSRFGTLTAIRFPAADYNIKTLSQKILSAIEPSQNGFAAFDVYYTGRKAAEGTTDFGGLIVSMSLFLIVAAMVLAGQVYSFALQRRKSQAGILAASGISKGQVFWIYLVEQAAVVLPATLLGIPGGAVFTRAILGGLNTVWADAAGGLDVVFSMRTQTVLTACAISIVLSLAVLWWKSRLLLKQSVADLLDRGDQISLTKKSSKYAVYIAIFLMAISTAMAWYGGCVSGEQSAKIFFGAGAGLLAAFCLLFSSLLSFLGRATQSPAGSVFALAIRNTARHKGRSLAVVLTLSMGVFVVFSTGSFKRISTDSPELKQSGTGGFTLWAQSSIPLPMTLNDSRIQKQLTPEQSSVSVGAVNIRQYSAEDASCLNLARAQRPILWAVAGEKLAGRFRFRDFLDKDKTQNPWDLLNQDFGQDVVPAIGDYATVYWGLNKKIGDLVDYVQPSGELFHLKIVALLDDSILQGGLIISEKQFLKRFDMQNGWSAFLIDVPADRANAVAKTLTQDYAAYGLQIMSVQERQAMYHRVENTYITIFMLLGSLGLILGSVGLGLVVLLNVLDRAGELAMMRAVGFEKSSLGRMLFMEHAGLMMAGLFLGIISALAASEPQLMQTGRFPVVLMTGVVATILISGFVWIAVAVKTSLGGDLMEPLRKE